MDYIRIDHARLYNRLLSNNQGILVLLDKKGFNVEWNIKLLQFNISRITPEPYYTKSSLACTCNRLYNSYFKEPLKLKSNEEIIEKILNDMTNC
jgi:hypothetical protein